MSKKPPLAALPFNDDPAIRETFADTVEQVVIDDSGLRILFGVTRVTLPKAGDKDVGGYRTVAARIVMPVQGLAALYNQLHQIVRGLEQQGLLSREKDGGVQPTLQ